MNQEGIVSRITYQSPVGKLELSATGKGIASLLFQSNRETMDPGFSLIKECVRQLDAYFLGKLKVFDLELDPEGSDFQKRVWKELLNIPFGETVSYIHIAKALGDKNSTRAVGNANGKNPICIIVPCHRVIGANGSLVGYGGGMENKKWLLEFERNLCHKDLFNSSLIENE